MVLNDLEPKEYCLYWWFYTFYLFLKMHLSVGLRPFKVLTRELYT